MNLVQFFCMIVVYSDRQPEEYNNIDYTLSQNHLSTVDSKVITDNNISFTMQ